MDTPDLSQLAIDRTVQEPTRPARRRRVRIALALAALAIAAALLARGLWRHPRVETVSAGLAYPAQGFTLLNATGYVVAQRKAAIASKASGRLEWLGVLEGSRVRKDELIARLENRDVRAALDQAQANVGVARANLAQAGAEMADAEMGERRAADLLGQHFIAQSTFEAAQMRTAKARGALAGMRAALVAAGANTQAAQVAFDQTMIRAPFDGVILTKNANVGDNITPFSSATDSKGAVVTLADMDTLEVEADVAESNLASIRVDQAAEIALDAFPDVRLAGRVSRMVPTLDRSKGTLLVKVRFVERDARVLPDMSARVAFLSRAVAPSERRPVVAVPPAALTRRDGRTVTFVQHGGRLRAVPVAPGRRIGDLIEAGGLAAGEQVVLKPAPGLADGMRVDVVKP